MDDPGQTPPPPPDRAQLRERLQVARLEARVRRAEAEARLLESFAVPRDQGWGSWVDPYDAYRDPDGRPWLPLGGRTDRKDGSNRPFVWTDLDLDWIRGRARWLMATNPLAQGALFTLRNFVVRNGYAYQAQPEKKLQGDTLRAAREVADQVQAVIDEFIDLNRWAEREQSAFLRSRRDGEAILRHFPQDDGTTLVRFVEPEQLRQPQGMGPEWSHGILTDARDIEDHLAYAVGYDPDDPADWDEIEADEISFIKFNADECVKRGLSDFYSVGEALDGTHKLLRNMREAGAVQAAIAWIEQFDGATASAVQAHVQAARDANRPYPDGPLTGKPVNYQKFEPGTIPKIGKGRTYIPAPLASNTTQHVSIVQACLRAVGARWNMPEFLISADASNSNYASTLSAGSPFVTAVECLQNVYKPFYLRTIWTAVGNACRAGRIRAGGRALSLREVCDLVDVLATPPQVALANRMEEAQIDQLDLQTGVLSKQTRRARRGLDDDQERQNLKEEPVQPPGQPGQDQGQGEGPGADGEAGRAGGFFPNLQRLLGR